MTTGAGNEEILESSLENTLPEAAATDLDQLSTPSRLVTALQREHPQWVSGIIDAFGEVTAVVPRLHIVDVCTELKSGAEAQFDFLADLCGVDRGVEEEPRFEVNYHLFSTTRFHRVRLKVILSEDDIHVPTVT